jgi:hypothetical protein
MKKILFTAAALLAGCSQPQSETQTTAAPEAAPAPAATSPASAATSQWLQIAHEANGGGVWVNPALISTDPATGLTDVILKVDHGQQQALDASGASNTLYRIERVTFRFNCANKTYAVAKREAINAKEDVLDTTELKLDASSFKPVAPNGVSSVAVSQACPAKPQ